MVNVCVFPILMKQTKNNVQNALINVYFVILIILINVLPNVEGIEFFQVIVGVPTALMKMELMNNNVFNVLLNVRTVIILRVVLLSVKETGYFQVKIIKNQGYKVKKIILLFKL